jgi:hypothetical protein
MIADQNQLLLNFLICVFSCLSELSVFYINDDAFWFPSPDVPITRDHPIFITA